MPAIALDGGWFRVSPETDWEAFSDLFIKTGKHRHSG